MTVAEVALQTSLDLNSYQTSLDLNSYQTSLDLNNFQTSLDLNNFQSSLDLNNFQTSLDLNNFQTSSDLNSFQSSMDLYNLNHLYPDNTNNAQKMSDLEDEKGNFLLRNLLKNVSNSTPYFMWAHVNIYSLIVT